MLILTFEDSEEEILNHIISCVNTGARAFQVIENAKTNLSYGDIVILLDKRELFRKQEKIDLSFIEFEILHLLMRSPGRVFSKEQIYDIIWNEPYSGDYNVVMRHICNIREKIEDDPGHMPLIEYYNDMNDDQKAEFRNEAFIPDDVGLELEHFEEFYEKRKALLTSKIRQLLG